MVEIAKLANWRGEIGTKANLGHTEFYEGATHVVTVASNLNYTDAMGLAISFFKKHLIP